VEGAIHHVEQLRQLIGIPSRLREFGVTEQMLPGFAEKSFAVSRLMNINPKPPTQEDLLQILREAL